MSSNRPLLADAVQIVDPADEIAKLRKELRELRGDFNNFVDEMNADRAQLGNILHALRAVFNGSPSDTAAASSTSAVQPPNEVSYRMWKERLPSGCGKIIDALLIQPLSQFQMRSACKMGASSISAGLKILRNNKIIELDGDLFRLRKI